MLTHIGGCASPACALLADFSRLGEADALPYAVSLDLARSVLEPCQMNQRFAYRIEPMESPAPRTDERLMIELCTDIPLDSLTNVRAAVDGATLPASTVQALSGEHCLLIDYPLEKIKTFLTVEFSLPSPYPVGEATIAFQGRDARLPLCGPVCSESPVGYYAYDVIVPFSVAPGALVGETLAWCCGDLRAVKSAQGEYRVTQRLLLAIAAEPDTLVTLGDASIIRAEPLT